MRWPPSIVLRHRVNGSDTLHGQSPVPAPLCRAQGKDVTCAGAVCSMTKKVFFYGLFMDANLLRERGCTPLTDTLARLDDYRLVVGQSKSTVVHSAGQSVWGRAMDVDEGELAQLYSGEQYAIYVPTPVALKLATAKRCEAICFIRPISSGDDAPDPAYLDALIRTAQAVGLPDDYVEGLSAALQS